MSVASIVLALLLAIATLGEGGASPGVLLALHALAIVAGAAAWLAPGGGAFRAAPGLREVVAGFSLVAIASAVLAPYGYAALLVLVEIAATLAAAFAACRCGPALAGRLAPTMAALLFLHGAIAIVRRMALGDPRPASSFLNPNHFAAWIVAAGFLVAGRLAAPERDRFRAFGFGALAFGAVAFAAIGSRGAALGAAAGLVVALATLGPTLPARARRAAIVAVLVAGTLAIAGVAWRFRTFDDPFAFQRLDIWRASLGAGLEAPALGIGPGQFVHESRRFNFPLEGETLRFARYFATPHSDAIRVAVELGLPAALAVLAGAFLVGLAIVRRRRRGALDPASAGAAAALAALVAQGLVDDLSGRPALVLLAAVLAGSLVATPVPPAPSPSRRTAWTLAAATIVLWGILDFAPWMAWRARAGEPAQTLRWNPYHPEPHLREAEAIASRAPDWNPEAFARADDAAAEAVRLSPRDPRYRRLLARVEATACRTLFPFAAYRDRVAVRYDEALVASPNDPTIALEAAGFLLDTGDVTGATRFAGRAAEIEPRAALPRLLLAESLHAAGEIARAREELVRAKRLESEGAASAATTPYHAALLRLPADRVARLSEAMGLAPGLEHQDVPQVVVPVPSPR